MMQYKELQGLENAYTVGMQNADGSDGFAIAYNEAYLHELMAILISRRSWVSVNPVGGTIAPGGSAALDLKFKTTSFPLGEFWASLEIRSNDPDEDPFYGGPFAPYRQSERKEIYQQYAQDGQSLNW